MGMDKERTPPMKLEEQHPEFQRGYAWGAHNGMVALIFEFRALLNEAPEEQKAGIAQIINILERK